MSPYPALEVVAEGCIGYAAAADQEGEAEKRRVHGYELRGLDLRVSEWLSRTTSPLL